ncbi:hypothetical protein CLAFUW4_09286 [Fulvia fulva]|uniref:Major royal jelly protein n=1 Tax=Passalora fulva TaxID=5499 RepID=A0A9Q8PH73_PASFU|nr:uncharacterized protein CLAFUR5_09387 [Fulvia fulva]KAK4613912.1 hypothetical protein CLAFUR4_09292 [Fulvia fulva]KAK4614930.1 hypothetical protein CLAFUR0_09284 [Fulvia fulva]UJO22355.1 hypothetical protein CLAFUR5_09387 [Fulvia fulva]WPV20810.1 hypothetical protein CLAFUW4_09286 [Fulvia fulva]WPV34811.1 hypothetical protein CLAFUW7_09287 [Fulvia fulva]
MVSGSLVALAGFSSIAVAQFEPNWVKNGEIWEDTVKYGPEMELQHLYYDQFPTGIAVSREGRKFSNYPPGLDGNNTNNGSNGKYTIAELIGNNTERPWPSAEMNNPPGGAINYTTTPPTGANYQQYIIGSQSIVTDAQNRAWILDTGRALTPNGTLVPASFGGPKLIGVDIASGNVLQTIVFPTTVAYADSYLNDVRFDLVHGGGYAYITDSSVEGRNGIIIADLATGESWRHLDGSSKVKPEDQNLPFTWGVPLYGFNPGKPFSYVAFGSDGIALPADSETLYWKVVGGRYLYSIPTARLRDNSANSEILAQNAINTLDTNDYIYHGNMEQNAIGLFNPKNGTSQLFVRDKRLNWIDTFSVGFDGYLYFTVNQLVFGSGQHPGMDRRQKPFSLWRVKLPEGGTKPGIGGSGMGNGTMY